MTDRLPCRACGHLILPTTAARNDGLCMPCKGGYRQNIEDGKHFHAERLALPGESAGAVLERAGESRLRWPRGFAGLSPA